MLVHACLYVWYVLMGVRTGRAAGVAQVAPSSPARTQCPLGVARASCPLSFLSQVQGLTSGVLELAQTGLQRLQISS